MLNLNQIALWLVVFMYLGAVSAHKRDFVKNGDVTKLPIPAPNEWLVTKSIPGWEVIGQAEYGYGRIYNPRWGNKVVVELDSNQNDIYRQKINLKTGLFFIEIEYAARAGNIETSQMSVSWNGKKIRFIKAQDEEIHIERIPVIAGTGENTLEIAGEGKSDGLGMTGSRVRLEYSGTYDFVENGDFSKLAINSPNEWVVSKKLTSWTILREVQYGYGFLYNSRWGDKIVIELDSNQNDILRQSINLVDGEYFIEIEYAGRQGKIATSQMSISWNGKKIRTIKAQDEEIHIETIPVTAVSGYNTLQIAGEGSSDGLGMTVSRVSLY